MKYVLKLQRSLYCVYKKTIYWSQFFFVFVFFYSLILDRPDFFLFPATVLHHAVENWPESFKISYL